MLKNITKLEHKIGERVFQLLCDNDSLFAEVKDALFQFMKYVGQIEDTAMANASKIAYPQEEVVEIPTQEVMHEEVNAAKED
jgi:hypothetical protein